MTWPERIATISINPDIATREDIARLAAELMVARSIIQRMRELIRTFDEEFPDVLP